MYNKASQNRQQAGWTRKLAFAGKRYAKVCMKQIIILLVAAYLVGCSVSPKKFPSESDIEGIWESTGVAFIPYSVFIYEPEGRKEVVLLGEEKGKTELSSYVFDSFMSSEENFTLTYIDEDEALDEPIVLKGEVYNGKILFIFEDEEDPEDTVHFWFIKSEYLDKYREVVFEYIKSGRSE